MKNLFKGFSISEKDDKYIQFSNIKFEYKEISNIEIDGQIFGGWKIRFFNCDFTGLKINNCYIRDCEFEDCVFKDVVINNNYKDSGIVFSGFFNCDFTNSNINQASMRKSYFKKCIINLDNDIFNKKNNWRDDDFNDFIKNTITLFNHLYFKC